MRLIITLLFPALVWHGFASTSAHGDIATKEKSILILIHSHTGKTLAAAQKIKEGLMLNNRMSVDIKRVELLSLYTPLLQNITLPIASLDELSSYDHIIFGSPVYFSGPAAEMMAFLQGAMPQWRDQTLKGKQVATFFTSNGNGVQFAHDALGATLRALHMDTNTLNRACGVDGDDFMAFGICLSRQMKTTSNDHCSTPLPPVPAPVGNYQPYKIVGNLVYVNQIALVNGDIPPRGKIGDNVTDEQAKNATRIAMLNVLAVLNQALNGELSRVKQVVQISGYFNAKDGYTSHSLLLNEASSLAIEFLGQERGKHTRGSFGVSSLPLDSPVELNVIFEIAH